MDKPPKQKVRVQLMDTQEQTTQQDALLVLLNQKPPSKPERRTGFVDHKGDRMKVISLRVPQQVAADMSWELKQNAGRVSCNTFIIEAINHYVQYRQRQRKQKD